MSKREVMKRRGSCPSFYGIKHPPEEAFGFTTTATEYESDESSSEESVAARIVAWSSGAAKMNGKKGSKDDTSLHDIKLNPSMNNLQKAMAQDDKSVASAPALASKYLKTIQESTYPANFTARKVHRGKAPRRRSFHNDLRDIDKATSALQRIQRDRNRAPRRSSLNNNQYLVNAPPPPPIEKPSLTASQKDNLRLQENDTFCLDPEAQKMSDIASKYLFHDIFAEDETDLSALTYRDGRKHKLWYYCYFLAFLTFILGAFVTYVVANTDHSKIVNTKDEQQSDSSSPHTELDIAKNVAVSATVDAVLPFLEKMSNDRMIDSGTPQSDAINWLISKDSVNAGKYNSTTQIIQRYILATLFYATKGSTAWDDVYDWLSPASECSWHGVTCFTTSLEILRANVVASIDLPFNGLSGEIPSEIGYLSYLRNLTLPENHLIGSIPATLTKLTNLLKLDLQGNAITGHLPDALDRLVELRSINLSGNRLKRRLPTALGNITPLEIVDLSENQLTGNIPKQYTNLQQLSYLNLEKNNLEGEVPYGIGNMKNLKIFNIAQNAFQGTIPSGLGDIKVLEKVNMQGNNFSGEVPAALSGSVSLVNLNLIKNSLEGTMPDEVCSLNLTELIADCDQIDCSCCTNCS